MTSQQGADREPEPAVGLRERKRARVQRDLADAALQLFSTKGYDATTVEDIADLADVSPRTFFRYYASKEDLLFSFPNRDRPLYFISSESFKEVLAEVLARPTPGDDLAAVSAALQAIAPSIEEYRERIAMFTTACESSAALRGRQADASRQLARWISDAMAHRRGGADEVSETVARVAITLFAVAVERWQASNGARSLQVCVAETFDQLPGLGARSRPRRAVS